MKSFLPTLLLLASLVVVVHAEAGFKIGANYKNGIAAVCTSEQFDRIKNVLHSFAEVDAISSQVVPNMAKFELAYEAYGEAAVVDHVGDLFTLPTMEESISQLSTEDSMEDEKYQAVLTSTVTVDEETGATQTTIEFSFLNRRRRELELMQKQVEEELAALAEAEPGNLRGKKRADLLPEHNETVLDAAHTMWRPVEGLMPAEHQNRALASLDCPVWQSGCYSSLWCLMMCQGHRRRRQLSETPAPSAEPSSAPSTAAPSAEPSSAPSTAAPSADPSSAPSKAPNATPSSAPSAAPSSAPSDAPSDAPIGTPSSAPSDAPIGTPSSAPSDAPNATPSMAPSSEPSSAPTDQPSSTPTDAAAAIAKQECMTLMNSRIAAMEQHVVNDVKKKLRFLARHEICPCLGNYWELQIEYKTNFDVDALCTPQA